MAADQQTAGPLAGELGKQVEILPGLQAINAGWFNGKPESMANSTYMLAPADWLAGDVHNTIPGSISGTEFTPVQRRRPQDLRQRPQYAGRVLAGVAIMIWTLMNARNSRDSLLTTHPLPNIGRVVITGNPVTGWRLVEWDGIRNFT